jgi:hypothetical protein
MRLRLKQRSTAWGSTKTTPFFVRYCIPNFWSIKMLLMTLPYCKDTIPKIRNKYSEKRNSVDSVPISTFMDLWAICIFQRSACLFCCRKYVDRSILWIYKLLTDTWMWKLGWGRAIPFLGIHKWDFRCSALCVTDSLRGYSRDDYLFIIAVQLLVQAGARADLYNDDLGLAPVHVACQQNRLDMLKVRGGSYVF